MAKFRVNVTSFHDNQLRQAGDIVEHTGAYANNMEPVDAEVNRMQALDADRISLLRRKAAAQGVPNEELPSDEAELRALLAAHGVDPKDLPMAPASSLI